MMVVGHHPKFELIWMDTKEGMPLDLVEAARKAVLKTEEQYPGSAFTYGCVGVESEDLLDPGLNFILLIESDGSGVFKVHATQDRDLGLLLNDKMCDQVELRAARKDKQP